MPTLVPTGGTQQFDRPASTWQSMELDYNAASATYPAAIIMPLQYVVKVGIFIATPWTGSSAACLFIGDNISSRSWFAQSITLTSAAAFWSNSTSSASANAAGTLYTSTGNIVAFYTNNTAHDTAGVALILTELIYLPDLNSGALCAAVQ